MKRPDPCTHKTHVDAGLNAATKLANDWSRHLPAEWRHAVEPPLYFESYSEYEIAAQRSVGYDADDRPCFTAHRFRLTEPASDDDEEFYEIVSCSEEMAAWRLRDGRWLVFRRETAGPCCPARGFYAFREDMPR